MGKTSTTQVLVAHACDPSYSGGREQEDCILGKVVHETLSQKKKKSQKRSGGVAQGVSPEFKLPYCKTKLLQVVYHE
jgi:hypothetical protein